MKSFDPISASRAVLIEVMNVLGAFRDDIVLIGGWVPDLLFPNHGHIGSVGGFGNFAQCDWSQCLRGNFEPYDPGWLRTSSISKLLHKEDCRRERSREG